VCVGDPDEAGQVSLESFKALMTGGEDGGGGGSAGNTRQESEEERKAREKRERKAALRKVADECSGSDVSLTCN